MTSPDRKLTTQIVVIDSTAASTMCDGGVRSKVVPAVPAVEFVGTHPAVDVGVPALLRWLRRGGALWAVVLAVGLVGAGGCGDESDLGPGRPAYPAGPICRSKVPCEAPAAYVLDGGTADGGR